MNLPNCIVVAFFAVSGLLGSPNIAIAAGSESEVSATQGWHIPDMTGQLTTVGSKVKYVEVKDAIPVRGTEYRIRVPENWNGTLVSDLDYHRAADSPKYLHLLEQGYAMSGTLRRPDRLENYDPAHEIHDIISVLDLFEDKFGKPARTIQYGCSGGGNVATGMAELHPDRIDGAITAGSPTSPWFTNTHLDGFFVLKALIAPELPIVDLPLAGSEIVEIGKAWQEALNAAQQTPEGRARIALAVTIGQWPAWGGSFGDYAQPPVPEPDPRDERALQESMYHGVAAVLPSSATFGHSMLEKSAGMLRWNTGVDYKEFFDNGDVFYKKAVKKLYRQADLSLKSDLERINAFPRIEADAGAVKWWSAPGRTHSGEPKVPLLRVHTNGDLLVYQSMVQGYETLVKQTGYSELFRSASVNSAGHCAFNLAETLAAFATLIQRLDTGTWPSTDPKALNTLAETLSADSSPRFHKYRGVGKYNRTWLPTAADFIGETSAKP